jgi:hypothetical protein
MLANTTSPFSYSRVVNILLPGIIFLLLLSMADWSEWYKVGWLGTPDIIAQYPFGSEEAIAEGGWHYQSASLYARTMLIEAVATLGVLGTFVAAVVKRNEMLVIVAYALLGIFLIVLYVVYHLTPS